MEDEALLARWHRQSQGCHGVIWLGLLLSPVYVTVKGEDEWYGAYY